MSNPLKKPLTIPPWQIPYLEKHKIYELFQEVARELVVQKPADHLLFMKQILQNAISARDTPRVIILSSPRINGFETAIEIAKYTEQVVISEYSLLRHLKVSLLSEATPEKIAKGLCHLVRTENAYKLGWIIVDCIHSVKEARNLLKLGILPTHVIHLIPPFYPNLTDLVYCHVTKEWPDYRRNMFQIREAFSSVLKEVHLMQRSLKEIAEECKTIIQTKPAPNFIKPRVIILGPRGSGRKTIARILQAELKLVHVDFEYLICQAWMAESELAEKLRSCKDQVCFHSDLLTQVVNKRVLEKDCLENGWVLTGFPYSEADLKYLDMIETPPSRIIFLDCELNICRERLKYRRTNTCTGLTTYLKDDAKALNEEELEIHPKDTTDIINAELQYYCENYGNMKKYCGNTAAVINADQNIRTVFDCVSAVITKALPPGAVRRGIEAQSVETASTDSCGCIPVPDKVKDAYLYNL